MTRKPVVPLLICAILLLIAVLRFIDQLFFAPRHDWDMDAFLYLGSRLWLGELLYQHDFETKLPFLQYLFAPAIALGGIGAWRIMSFVLIVVLAFLASRILTGDAIRRSGHYSLGKAQLSFFVFGVFLALLYCLPGSRSSHISMLAAASAYLSLALLFAHQSMARPFASLFLSGVAFALAALIRPNYVYVFPVLFAVLVIDLHQPDFREASRRMIILLGGFIALTGSSIIPYLLVPHGTAVLLDGLRALYTFSQGMQLDEIITEQVTAKRGAWFYVLLYAACTLAALVIASRPAAPLRNLRIYAGAGILAVVLLNLGFTRTHYWPHYAIMFLPCAVLLLLYLWKAAERAAEASPRLKSISALAGPTVLAVCAVLATTQVTNMVAARSSFDPNINERNVDDTILQLLRQAHSDGQTFLVVDSAAYHAFLGESRIGDGHPFMLDAALSGRKIGPVSDIKLFAAPGTEAACKAILLAGKDIIVLDKESALSQQVLECLRTEPGAYQPSEDTPRFSILRRTGR